jgi:hypothetical protein
MKESARATRTTHRWWMTVLFGVFTAAVANPAMAWDERGWEGTDGWESEEGYDEEADGPGTQYRRCLAEAWSNYNDCLMSSASEAERRDCDRYHSLDMMACDLELMGSMIGRTASWLKGILK